MFQKDLKKRCSNKAKYFLKGDEAMKPHKLNLPISSLCFSNLFCWRIVGWWVGLAGWLVCTSAMYLYTLPSSAQGTKKTNLATEKYYFIRTWESLVSIMKWLPLLLPFLRVFFLLAAWKRAYIIFISYYMKFHL